MHYKEIEFDKLSKRIVEQAYASASQVLDEEQKRKLIQDKFDRAKALYEAQQKSPVYED
jgi:hypothetical protein